MTTNAHTNTEQQPAALIHPAPNEYEGKHRPGLVAGHSWAPAAEYGPVPIVPAGVGISLGSYPHLTLADITGALVEVPLTPEQVEQIEAAVLVRRAVMEAKRAEQESAEIEASLARQDAHYRKHPRTEATA
jgi:hypothetical protein